MTDAAWYYAIDGRQRGPVDERTLRALVAQGVLRPGDLIWCDGMPEWVAAETMPGLFAPSAGATTARLGATAAQPASFQPQSQSQPQPEYAASPAFAPSPAPLLGYYAPGHSIVYAGFWIRFVAAVIDGVILIIAGATIAGCLVGCVRVLATDPMIRVDARLWTAVAARVGGIVFGWLYESLMLSSRAQATLGKLAVGIKVVAEDGSPLSFGRATGRHFAKFLSAAILLIGYIMVAFSDRKQALHDTIARTLVIYDPNR